MLKEGPQGVQTRLRNKRTFALAGTGAWSPTLKRGGGGDAVIRLSHLGVCVFFAGDGKEFVLLDERRTFAAFLRFLASRYSWRGACLSARSSACALGACPRGLPSRWSGDEAAKLYRAAVIKTLRKHRGHKVRYMVFEDSGPPWL